MKIKLGTCQTCCWFHDPDTKGKGECRGFPPQVVVDFDGNLNSVWPQVDSDDVCILYTSAIRGGVKKSFQEIMRERHELS